MAKKKLTSLPYCVCEKSAPGHYPHALGFAAGVGTHILAFIVLGIAIMQNQPGLLIVPAAWAAFHVGYFLWNYFEYTSDKHSRECSLRHALLSAIFMLRGV